jgi:hypothetical protein
LALAARRAPQGLTIVERQLAERTVRMGEEELFKARAREQGSIKLIDIVRAKLDAKSDSFVAELPSLAIKDVRIDDNLVKQHERMLTDGRRAAACPPSGRHERHWHLRKPIARTCTFTCTVYVYVYVLVLDLTPNEGTFW